MTRSANPLLRACALSAGLLGASTAFAAGGTVAFLMPDQASTRYEQHDFPGFKAEMAKLCPDCKVLYQNANAVASQQQQQFNSVLSQGAKVIVLDPVDSTAAASLVHLAQGKGVKVIAYDRPVPSTPADYYVSFDNEGIGKAIAQSLVAHLNEKGVATDKGGVLEVNGSPTDAAAVESTGSITTTLAPWAMTALNCCCCCAASPLAFWYSTLQSGHSLAISALKPGKSCCS